MYKFISQFNLIAMALVPILLAVADTAEHHREDDIASLIKPYTCQSTAMIAYVDLQKLNVDTVFKSINQTVKLTSDQKRGLSSIKSSTKIILGGLKNAGVDQIIAMVSLEDIEFAMPVLILKLDSDEFADEIVQTVNSISPAQFEAIRKKKHLILGHKDWIKSYRNRRTLSHNEIDRAVKDFSSSIACVSFVTSDDMRRVIQEMLPKLPEPFSDLDGGQLKDWIRCASFAYTNAANFEFEIKVHSSDSQSANQLREYFNTKTVDYAKSPWIQSLDARVSEFLSNLRLLGKNNVSTINFKNGDKGHRRLFRLIDGLNSIAENAEKLAKRTDRIRQIAFALHDYYDVNKSFMLHGNFDQQGTPLLSWRVHLLPYLGEKELYDKFRLNEAWNSDHNKVLIDQIPVVFQPDEDRKAPSGNTTIQMCVGDTVYKSDKRQVKFDEIKDGTSQTILLVDRHLSNAVPWTQPTDWQVSNNQLKSQLFGPQRERVVVAMFDAATGVMRKYQTSDDLIKALITIAGNEVIKPDQLPQGTR